MAQTLAQESAVDADNESYVETMAGGKFCM